MAASVAFRGAEQIRVGLESFLTKHGWQGVGGLQDMSDTSRATVRFCLPHQSMPPAGDGPRTNSHEFSCGRPYSIQWALGPSSLSSKNASVPSTPHFLSPIPLVCLLVTGHLILAGPQQAVFPEQICIDICFRHLCFNLSMFISSLLFEQPL